MSESLRPASTIFSSLRQVLESRVFLNAENLYGESPLGELRWQNLARYLKDARAHEVRSILVGEAPGYRGTTVTGVPFRDLRCSEWSPSDRTAIERAYEGEYGIAPPSYERTSGFVEGIVNHAEVLLWAIFPLHPYKPESPLTNRKPRPEEVAFGGAALDALLQFFTDVDVFAVGRVAEQQLSRIGIRCKASLRHPARGGERLFGAQLTQHGLAVASDGSTAR